MGMSDWHSPNDRSGVDIRVYPDGIYVSGWYDTMVGIEGGFVAWEELMGMRRRFKRRAPFSPLAKNVV